MEERMLSLFTYEELEKLDKLILRELEKRDIEKIREGIYPPVLDSEMVMDRMEFVKAYRARTGIAIRTSFYLWGFLHPYTG